MNISADSTVCKLIVLCLLEKIEIPLSENSILEICSSRNNWINYMECKEVLYNLKQVGFIYSIDKNEEEARFSITIEGRNCLSHFYKRIPHQMRDEIADFAKKNRLLLKRSQEYLADYEKVDDGSYNLSLRIRSPQESENTFKIELKAPSRASAIEACKLWKEKAPQIFEAVYENLIDE